MYSEQLLCDLRCLLSAAYKPLIVSLVFSGLDYSNACCQAFLTTSIVVCSPSLINAAARSISNRITDSVNFKTQLYHPYLIAVDLGVFLLLLRPLYIYDLHLHLNYEQASFSSNQVVQGSKCAHQN